MGRRLEKNYSICNTRIFGLFRGLFAQYNILQIYDLHIGNLEPVISDKVRS